MIPPRKCFESQQYRQQMKQFEKQTSNKYLLFGFAGSPYAKSYAHVYFHGCSKMPQIWNGLTQAGLDRNPNRNLHMLIVF